MQENSEARYCPGRIQGINRAGCRQRSSKTALSTLHFQNPWLALVNNPLQIMPSPAARFYFSYYFYYGKP
jgi:hypothetical protein